MALLPDYDTFAAKFAAGENQVVYTRLTKAALTCPTTCPVRRLGCLGFWATT